MINIKIRFPDNVDGAEIVHTICERLRGDLALFANDANDGEKREKTILISLGEDANKKPRVVNVDVNIHAVDNVPI